VIDLWRDPRRAGLLMGAWFLVSLLVRPVVYVHAGTGGTPLQPPTGVAQVSAWVVSAFFAWRVARGGRISRMLLIIAAGAGLIAAVIALAIGATPAELGQLAATGAQLALLLSPAVYQRTRPADPDARTVVPWRQRDRPRLVAALALTAALGLAGAAACCAVISSRLHGYDAATVTLHPGYPVRAALSPGRYDVMAGCMDYWGCPDLAPGAISVQGAASAAAVAPYSLPATRIVAGQQFIGELHFTVPVREQVQVALNVRPRQAVLIMPSPSKRHFIAYWVAAAVGCAALLLGSLAGLAWPRAPRSQEK
jgi:hypothetical protein